MGRVLFTSCFNESSNIENHILEVNELLKNGVIDHFLLIDDGSRDGTVKKAAEKIRSLGIKAPKITFLKFAGNMGKATSFFEALKFYKSHFGGTFPKGQILVTLDADLDKIGAERIKSLSAPIENNSARMAVGTVVEGLPSTSGQRAFELSSFESLLSRNELQGLLLGGKRRTGKLELLRGGFGLEIFLNYYFTHSVDPFSSFQDKRFRVPHIIKSPLLPTVCLVKTDFTTQSFTDRPKGHKKNRGLKGRSLRDNQRMNAEIFGVYSRLADRHLASGLMKLFKAPDRKGVQKFSRKRSARVAAAYRPNVPRIKRIL